jgi:acyl-CoA synthetase (AMP-forming)/AMP-acid ligase II
MPEMDAQPRTIGEVIRQFARCRPDAPAIQSAGSDPLSYAALARCLDDLHVTLNRRGLGHGDRVAFYSPDKEGMAACFLGIADCATAVPLDPALDAEESATLLIDTAAKALVVERDSDSGLRAVAETLGLAVIDLLPGAGGKTAGIALEAGHAAAPKRSQKAALSDIAVILQTGGTTSEAKLVPLSHRNFTDRALKKGR